MAGLRSTVALAAAGALALVLLGAGSARADSLNFYFSFTDNVSGIYGSPYATGTVTGEVFGLQDNAISSATDVVIFSSPQNSVYPSGSPLDAITGFPGATGWTVPVNEFEVVSGNVADAFFIGADGGGQSGLGLYTAGPDNEGIFAYQGSAIENESTDGSIGNLSFTPAPVPEFGTLFGLGGLTTTGGLALMRRRRK
jgi:hypothetical protein